MSKVCAPFFLILFFSISLFGQDLFIQNANIIDVSKGKLIKSQDIRIKNGIITEIGRALKNDLEEIIDAKGKYLIPGLIDAHMHLFQSGGLYARPDMIDVTEIKPYSEERLWTLQNAEDILNRYTCLGITNVIDLGGPAYQFNLRDSLNKEKNSATVFLTGPLISNYVPEQLNVKYPPIIKVDSVSNAVDLVNVQHEFGADFIKIWYLAVKPQDALDFYPIVESVCRESEKLRLPVAVHATNLYTAKLALKAGAKFLVHSVRDIHVDDEFLELLAKSKAVYCPTLQVSKQYDNVSLDEYTFTEADFEYANPSTVHSILEVKNIENNNDLDYYNDVRSSTYQQNTLRDSIQLVNLKKVLSAGLPIALGTDAGNIGTLHASSFYRELDMFKAAGMSNIDLLKAMTVHPALAIKQHGKIGSININRQADILLLNTNPLENIDAVKNIDTIIKGGKIVNASEIIKASPEMIVQQQMNGYNGHSLNAFLEPYAEDVRIFEFPDKLVIEGKDQLRKEYQFINEIPDLNSQLVNRLIKEDTVVDYLNVTVDVNEPSVQAVAIYKIENYKIKEVYFIN
jgi:imidazolonepropionase-like amidohydrolase